MKLSLINCNNNNNNNNKFWSFIIRGQFNKTITGLAIISRLKNNGYTCI